MSKKIHRITAKDEAPKEVKAPEKAEVEAKKVEKKAEKPKKTAKKAPKWLLIITWPFRMIAKPFIALGRYIHDSWLELRQVRWPSRGATWKMFLAIILYAGLFMGIIALLDMLFTWLFNLIIG